MTLTLDEVDRLGIKHAILSCLPTSDMAFHWRGLLFTKREETQFAEALENRDECSFNSGFLEGNVFQVS